MSRDPAATMAEFLTSLDLSEIDENCFVGRSPDFGWARIFGGQFIGQSLVAAQRTVGSNRSVHSLHGYFLRPGDPEKETTYIVDRLRDGMSFSVRSVRAEQAGRPVFTMQASFHKEEQGFEHGSEMPDVPGPDEIVGLDAFEGRGDVVSSLLEYSKRERPFEFRPVSIDRYIENSGLAPIHSIWLKPISPISSEPDTGLGAAIVAYMSDMILVDTALFPHATNVFDGTVQGASLDHAIWFHRPFHFDDWVLYHMDSPAAFGARGMARGSLFSRKGELIASVAQEGLIRKRAIAR